MYSVCMQRTDKQEDILKLAVQILASYTGNPVLYDAVLKNKELFIRKSIDLAKELIKQIEKERD